MQGWSDTDVNGSCSNYIRPEATDPSGLQGSTGATRNRAAQVRWMYAVVFVCLALHTQNACADADSSVLQDRNDVLAFGPVKVSRWLTEALVKAADATGVEPAHLMAFADKESGLRPDSRAETSSAEGLFQFIESTWLDALRQYGVNHGLTAVAVAIEYREGRAAIVDESQREWILTLRRDPYLSALMAGEILKRHREILAGKAERDPSLSDLYAAHFLGIYDAARLIKLAKLRPSLNATRVFPRAAKANRGVFFMSVKGRSRALSIGQLRARLAIMIKDRLARYQNVRQELQAIQLASNDRRLHFCAPTASFTC
jgi:Transglycosylase SLT domain